MSFHTVGSLQGKVNSGQREVREPLPGSHAVQAACISKALEAESYTCEALGERQRGLCSEGSEADWFPWDT